MKKLIAGLLALAMLGLLGWKFLLVTPEKVIKGRLQELAKAVSVRGDAAPLAKLSNAQKVLSFCSPEIEIVVDVPGQGQRTVSGQDDLRAGLIAFNGTLNVEFLDLEVRLEPDRQNAVALLTARARLQGERDDYIQELKFNLRKIEGEWRIIRIQTIKTFSALRPHLPAST